MVIPNVQRQKVLQLWLYSGIALIVISMLFLGRGQESSSFVVQALDVLAAPIFFYFVGMLVSRYANAPLAAPGIIATGAWLVGVDLIHLYDQRILLPVMLQPYYWLGASLLAGFLITLTGHRVKIWMLVPLVPLVQVNALWAVLSVLGIPVQFMPAISFALVLLWWEAPRQEARWSAIYRVSAALLALVLLVFTVWLPLTTPQSMMVTWGAGAAVVAVIGFRYGWLKLGPLAIVMLTFASIWGLHASWWPTVWLALAASTVIFIEHLGARREKAKDAKAMEISQALAVALSGIAAVFAEAAPFFNVPMHPFGSMAVLAGAGLLLAWLGWRRDIRLAAHVGLWLIAAAWASLYFITVPASGTFGLWLALLAASALLIERLAISGRKEKHKSAQSLTKTVTYWPVADLVIGLSALILIWSAINITSALPWVVTVTVAVVIGLWIATGLIYRLPILLHIALWVAPLPYALLLIIIAPSIWSLPLLGVAWQILGITFLVMGHSMPRYRLTVLAPFFLTGYTLIGFGFTFAMNDATLMPVSLSLLVLTSLATSAAVIADYHSVWSAFVAWLVPPDKRPFAFKNIHHLFLALGAFLAAIWLHLMLGYTGLALPRQGIFMVALACVWFMLGRLLARLPGVVGWPVISAGWLMWLIGLLEVFYSPREAIVVVILGLVISGDTLRRSKAIYWIPVMIMQVFFTVLQITLLMALPGRTVLMLVALAVSVGGMVYERQGRTAGRVIALTGGALILVLGAFYPDATTMLVLGSLAVTVTVMYRDWRWLGAVYLCIAAYLFKSKMMLEWHGLLIAGGAQLLIGAELMRLCRPRRYRTVISALVDDLDWATPFLWVGALCTVVAFALAYVHNDRDILPVSVLAAVLSAIYTIRLRMRDLPYFPLVLLGIALISGLFGISSIPFDSIGTVLIEASTGMILLAIAIKWSVRRIAVQPGLISSMRWLVWWLRPLTRVANWLSLLSLVMLLIIGPVYHVSPVMRIANGVLIVVLAVQVYARDRQRFWLWGAVAMAWYTWALALTTLGWVGPMWHTLPLGIVLIYLGRVMQDRASTLFESAGTVVLLAGAGLSVDRTHLISPASLALVAHLGGLILYGYRAGRRIPFSIAFVLTLSGIVMAVARINMWLIPLACGLLLLAGALFMEVQRDLVEQWVSRLVVRWQQWR